MYQNVCVCVMFFFPVGLEQGEQALVSGDLLHKFCQRCSEPTGHRSLLEGYHFFRFVSLFRVPSAWRILTVNLILWFCDCKPGWNMLKIDSGSLHHLMFCFRFFKFTDAPVARVSPGSHQLFLDCPMKAHWVFGKHTNEHQNRHQVTSDII